jgi:hypothetical protein
VAAALSVLCLWLLGANAGAAEVFISTPALSDPAFVLLNAGAPDRSAQLPAARLFRRRERDQVMGDVYEEVAAGGGVCHRGGHGRGADFPELFAGPAEWRAKIGKISVAVGKGAVEAALGAMRSLVA